VTFHIVCLGWVFFRADTFSTAITMLTRVFTAWGSFPLVTPLLVLAIAVGIGLQFLPRGAGERVVAGFTHLRPALQGVAVGVVLFVITAMGPQGVAPFIYYQF
jgi:alginate O-acetyltransferase complex protein AlgI